VGFCGVFLGGFTQKKPAGFFAYLPGFLNPGSLSQKLYKTDTW